MADPAPTDTRSVGPPPAGRAVRRTRVRTLSAAGGIGLLTAALTMSAVARDSPPADPVRGETIVRVSADKVLGRYDNPARYQNQSGPNSPLGPRDLQLVKALDVDLARVWLIPRGYYAGSGRYDFDFSGGDGTSAHRYLDQAAGYARRLLANLGECAPELMTLGEPEECRRVLRDGLTAYKRRYPTIRYVELFNEPHKTWEVPDGEWAGLSARDYYGWYRLGYSIVNEINWELRPTIPLRIGGPAAASFDEPFLREFLDRYERDPDPGKRLDFLSYHQYGRGADPARVGTEKQTVRGWLADRGLDPDTPVFVTEYGVFPGDAKRRSFREDLLTQAAAMQTLSNYYVSSGMDAVMHWVFRHPSNPRKSMFAPGIDGGAQPYYNVVRMQRLMKDWRVAATSDGLSPAGLGVNAMATVDDSGVGVLATNYQWVTGESAQRVSMRVDLPDELAHRPLRLDRYLVDATTGNAAHHTASSTSSTSSGSSSSSTLQRVEERAVFAGASVETTFGLEPNALSLVVLTPMAG